MSHETWPVDEAELQSLNEALSMIKTAAERQEGLENLEHFPMNLSLLMRSGAGKKICRVFKSSRFYNVAHRTHTKWLQKADEELQKNWDQLKHKFLDKKMLTDLEKAQAEFEKTYRAKSMSSSQGLLQIAPSTSQLTKTPTSASRPLLQKMASVPSYYNYQGNTPTYTSVTGPGSAFSRLASGSDRKRGRPKSGKLNTVYAPTSAPVGEVQSIRSSGRKARIPTRFLD